MTTDEAAVDLQGTGERLLAQARDSSARKAAQAVFVGPGLRAVLVALAADGALAEHNAPAAATLQCLRGRARLWAASSSWELAPGDLAAVPPERHGVDALEECVLLLTVAAGRAPEPVELAVPR